MVTLQVEKSPKLSEVKVSYRRRAKTPSGPPILGAMTAADYLRGIWNKDTLDLIEEFYAVFLDTSNTPTGWIRASIGGLDCANVDPRVIYSVALSAAATGIIVAHNHPSGSLTPSEHDKRLTNRLKHAAELLCIRFVDHIILTGTAHMSFAEAGFL